MKTESNYANKATPRVQPRGSVLFMGLMFVVIATSVMLAMCSATFTNADRTSDMMSREESYFAARGFNELVVSDIEWGHKMSGQPDLRTYLASTYTWTTVPAGSDTIADALANSAKDQYGNSLLTQYPGIKKADVSNKYATLAMGSMMPGRARIYRRDRNDNNGVKNSDFLVVTESMRNLGFSPSQVQAKLANPTNPSFASIIVGQDASWYAAGLAPQNPPQFAGFEYAILTKNLTCTLCHLKVQDLSRSKNKNSTFYNSYSRVKVGTTQFMATRPGSSASNIEGTLYHRGKLEDEQGGTALTPAQFAASTNTSTKFNATTPVTVYQDASGNTQSATFVNMTSGTIDPITGATSNAPLPNGNLYLNYPTSTVAQTDGILPGSTDFPAPFTDLPSAVSTGQTVPNSRIDPGEVDLTVAKYNNPGNANAAISGGNITLAPAAGYVGTALPTTGNTGSVTNGATGNYIITGTTANPIKIDGTVVVKGDVMINGYVEGAGQIYATGNIYVPGDVIYKNTTDASGNENFGQNGSGQSGGTNLLGLIAGGNIVIGDYLSGVTHWDSSKTDFVKPNYNGTAAAGQPDPGVGIPYWKSGNGTAGNPYKDRGTSNPYTDLAGMGSVTNVGGTTVGNSNMANFTVEQLAVFNREELIRTTPLLPKNNDIKNSANYTGANPFYDSTHVPRYYTMYPDNFNPYKDKKYLGGTDASGNGIYNSATSVWAADPSATKKAKSPVPLFVNNNSPWDTAKNRFSTAGDPHTYNTLSELSDLPASKMSPLLPDANYLSIHPSWITPDNMMRILSDTESKRTANTARRVDGLLYTNNAIFAIERKQTNYFDPNTSTWSKKATKSNGTLTVNGAMIAPDLGVLVTGNANPAFLVNYDARVKQFLPITSASTLEWAFGRQAFIHGSGLLP